MKNIPKNNKAPKVKQEGIPIHGWRGVAILFVCVSIAYANYMVYFGTNDMVSRVMLIPSALFVAIFLLYKAVK
jgi:hypothetical protein